MLSRRHGSMLSRRSILKSYTAPQGPKRGPLAFDGITDVRQAVGMPVLSVGTCSVQVCCLSIFLRTVITAACISAFLWAEASWPGSECMSIWHAVYRPA